MQKRMSTDLRQKSGGVSGGKCAQVGSDALARVFAIGLLRRPDGEKARTVKFPACGNIAQFLRCADPLCQRRTNGAERLNVRADLAAGHGTGNKKTGVGQAEMQARFRTQGLASVRVGKTECCTVRARLRQKLPRQMVGADASRPVVRPAEGFDARALFRIKLRLPACQLFRRDGPPVKNGAKHGIHTTAPAAAGRHTPPARSARRRSATRAAAAYRGSCSAGCKR